MTHYFAILDGSSEVWGVRVPDLPGVHGAGETPEAAILDAASAAREWAAHAASRDTALPAPSSLADALASGEIRPREAVVLIPLVEYEHPGDAAEDAADVRAYDKAKRRLASGEDELIPGEVVNRLLAGENKVRVWREHRGMTVKALAEASGLAPAHLSQVENAAHEETMRTLKKIAAALRVDIDDLL